MLSEVGALANALLAMLTCTRRSVMRRVTRPGMESGGMTKETQEMATNIPDGRK